MFEHNKSFITASLTKNFSINNLPYGIFSSKDNPKKRLGVAIEDYVLDLSALSHLGYLDLDATVVENSYLNDFMALGKKTWKKTREIIQDLLDEKNPLLRDNKKSLAAVLVAQDKVTMHMPVKVGDYTDFYSSKEHATNVGSMFRDKANPLLPNWKHLPVAYHGRASSIVTSNTSIKRPFGQLKESLTLPPELGACKKLDFELEVGFFIGKDSSLGSPIAIQDASDYIFGISLVNDWSARDIQKWEYVPLGPFVSKSFATSISHWVTPMAALQPFLVKGPKQDPTPLSYLSTNKPLTHYDINLTVELETANKDREIISRANMKWLYWSIEQQLSHHTITGCNVRVGDLLASGTISGTEPSSYGSLLELSWNGEKPLSINKNTRRSFLEDGDKVTMSACANKDQTKLALGEVTGTVLST